MAAPIPLHPDFKAPLLRKLARGSRDPDLIRRLLALAEIHDGGTRTDAARIGGVSGCRSCVTGCCGSTPRVSRWPCERQGAGPAPSLLNDHQRQAPRQVVDDGPMPAVHGVVRWRLIDLAHWLFEEFSRRSAANCATWAFVSSRQGRTIMRKTRKRLQFLKKLPRHRGGSHSTTGWRQTDRDLVPR
jgi:hypothetical protein